MVHRLLELFVVVHMTEWEEEVKVHLWGRRDMVLVVVNWELWRLEQFLEFMAKLSEELMNGLGKLRELHSEDMVVRKAVPELLDLLLEQVLLDVLSLDRLVPLKVIAVDISRKASKVFEKSVDFSHSLHVGIAGVILDVHLEDIEEFRENIDGVVEESFFHVGFEQALFWIVEAPRLDIITNSLELAVLHVVVVHVDQLNDDVLDLIDRDLPDVLMIFVSNTFGLVNNWVDPVSEALVTDNVLIGLVESLGPASIGCLEEFSVSLQVIQFLGIRFRAVVCLLQKPVEWLVVVVVVMVEP